MKLNPSVVALVGVLLCCLFAKIEASARATGEAAAGTGDRNSSSCRWLRARSVCRQLLIIRERRRPGPWGCRSSGSIGAALGPCALFRLEEAPKLRRSVARAGLRRWTAWRPPSFSTLGSCMAVTAGAGAPRAFGERNRRRSSGEKRGPRQRRSVRRRTARRRGWRGPRRARRQQASAEGAAAPGSGGEGVEHRVVRRRRLPEQRRRRAGPDDAATAMREPTRATIPFEAIPPPFKRPRSPPGDSQPRLVLWRLYVTPARHQCSPRPDDGNQLAARQPFGCAPENRACFASSHSGQV